MDKAIELMQNLAVAPAVARDNAFFVLQSLAKREPPYEQVALELGLRELHIPIDASIRVPIDASVTPHPMRWESELDIVATSGATLFPKLHATITITPNGVDASELWLQGSYEPPLGAFGAGVDASLLHAAAESSLRRFLAWLAEETIATADRREREHLQAMRGTHL